MANTTISKNKEGYGYKYTDLSQIHEYLEANNMKYYQEIEAIDGIDYIMTYRFIDGKWEEKPKKGCRVVQATLSGIKNPAQEQGSALTYARRYSLLMAFGLATDDDDAQSLTIEIEPTKEDAEKYVILFGKHKGEKLTEIDDNYKEWLLNNSSDKYLLKCLDLLTDNNEKIKRELRGEFVSLITAKGIDYNEIFEKYGVENSSEMTIEQLQKEIKELKR